LLIYGGRHGEFKHSTKIIKWRVLSTEQLVRLGKEFSREIIDCIEKGKDFFIQF
jgi:hypothetical protein